jgi:hypothetical protein
MARFETARIAWQYDAAFADSIVRKILATDPNFIPRGAAAPLGYRLAMRFFGFAKAEKMAEWRRKIPLRHAVSEATG